MRSVSFFIVFISLFTSLNAQDFMEHDWIQHEYRYSYNAAYDFYFHGRRYIVHKTYRDFITDNQISEVKSSTFKFKKGEKEEMPAHFSKRIYNLNGDLTYSEYGRKDEVKNTAELKFNNNNLLVEYSYKRKGNMRYQENIKYNNAGKALLYELKKGKKMKPSYYWTAAYNDSNKVVEKMYLKDEGKKLTTLWKYDYYNDGTKKETKYYRKGKLKKIWSYDCDSEGKEVDMKDTVEICEFKEYNNDGSYTLITRSTYKKGKIRKQRVTYSADDKIIEYMTYNNKGKITWGYKKEYEGENVVYYANYYRDKLRSETWRKFDENGKLKERKWKSNKHEFVTSYLYFENGKIQEKIQTRDGEKRLTWTNTLDDRGNINSTTKYNHKKEKNVKISYYDFTYYK